MSSENSSGCLGEAIKWAVGLWLAWFVLLFVVQCIAQFLQFVFKVVLPFLIKLALVAGAIYAIYYFIQKQNNTPKPPNSGTYNG